MRPGRVARQVWRGTALAGIGVIGGAAVVTLRHMLMTPQPLDSGLPGAVRIDRRHGGDLYYAVAGPMEGRPLVLLHGFYPGASNYEFRAVFSRLAETYRVYAPDWLGFGMSERPRLTHTGEFYASMLRGFLRDIVGAPATVVAHGLAGNVAVAVASESPELFERLTLVAPEVDAGERLDPTFSQAVARLFEKFALGVTPYALLSLRPALRLAAGRRSAIGPAQVDDDTLDHLYASAHQSGAEHATLSLLTGELDLPMRHLFPRLATPTLIVVGELDPRHTSAEMERLVTLNPHADLEVVSHAGETVYLDQPKLFINVLRRWRSRRVSRYEPIAVQAPATATVVATIPSPASGAQTAVTPQVTPQVNQAVAPQVAPRLVPIITAAETTAQTIVAPASAGSAQGAPAVKVVPVLEPRAQRALAPDMRRSSSDPVNLARPRRVDTPSTPTSHAPQDSHRTSDGRSAHAPGDQRSASYTYTPQTGIHTLRTDRGSRRSPHSR